MIASIASSDGFEEVGCCSINHYAGGCTEASHFFEHGSNFAPPQMHSADVIAARSRLFFFFNPQTPRSIPQFHITIYTSVGQEDRPMNYRHGGNRSRLSPLSVGSIIALRYNVTC